MKSKTLIPWMGAKANLAPAIVRELGPHRGYWEPMCGSMATLLAKPVSPMELVNDLHGDLINLALVARHPKLSKKLYDRLYDTWHCEPIQRESRDALRHGMPSPPDLQRAYDYFVASWMGRCGNAGTSDSNSTYAMRYTTRGGSSASRFAHAVDALPWFRDRMRSVAISSRDAFEVIERIEDADGTAIYLDPPYLSKSKKYIHDFADSDHERLAKAVARFKHARVVVSYYDDPRLAELYPNWHVRRIEVTKSLASGVKRGTNESKAQEVLLANGPLAEEMLF